MHPVVEFMVQYLRFIYEVEQTIVACIGIFPIDIPFDQPVNIFSVFVVK